MIEMSALLNLPGILEGFGKRNPQEKLKFCADTREIQPGESFIALDGPTFKPLKFLPQLKDAPVIVYTKNKENDALAQKYQDRNFFLAVEDSLTFFQEMARCMSEAFQRRGGKMIAISGSNGKTTTKEMLFHLLDSVEGDVVRTLKNNNNHIGVPLSIAQITEKTRFCVLELGSNHPGEIKTLCEIAVANVGVTTNIGDTHLEFFQTRENVFREEAYLYHALKEKEGEKLYFINRDDEYLKALPKTQSTLDYGSSAENDLVIKAGHDGAEATWKGKTYKIENGNVTGEHNFLNLALACAMASAVSQRPLEDYLKPAKNFAPTTNRSQWIKIGKSKIFLDAYNANPSSMRAAIKAFKAACSGETSIEECALVLGDMNELGSEAERYHRELGEFAYEEGFRKLFFVGRFSGAYNSGCKGIGVEISDAQSLTKEEKRRILDHPRCFIKGSRSLQLESITDIN